MREKGFPSPEPVTRLSEHIALDTLPITTPAGTLTIGVADDNLDPIGVTAQGVLMVSGPPGSGRSTTLLTLAQAVRRHSRTTRIVYLAPHDSPIAGVDVWSDVAVGVAAGGATRLPIWSSRLNGGGRPAGRFDGDDRLGCRLRQHRSRR